jgi:glutathione synthase/RimK-type ligase-like ATP-grasp enzyme
LICISEPKNIHGEWRLVIADKKIVAYSQYKKHGETNLLGECPNYIQKFAKIVVNSIDIPPDPCYTIDIAEESDGPSVIELNSLSCSGLYKCNIPDVIKAVREVVIKDYEYYTGVPF